MARQAHTQLRGRIGNVDFYGRNGLFFAKAASTQCRQTTATKQQAVVFGKASRIASLLWQYLKPWSADYANNNAWNRLNRAVANCVRMEGLSQNAPQNKLPYITGFQFNTATVVGKVTVCPAGKPYSGRCFRTGHSCHKPGTTHSCAGTYKNSLF